MRGSKSTLKILIDTNVILDYIMERDGFWEEAEGVLLLTERNDAIEFMTATSVTDVFYILKKYYSDSAKAQEEIAKIFQNIKILGVAEEDIRRALELRWRDFEDAVQYSVALRNDIDCIVTRNPKDFEADEIPVFTPAELLKVFDTYRI